MSGNLQPVMLHVLERKPLTVYMLAKKSVAGERFFRSATCFHPWLDRCASYPNPRPCECHAATVDQSLPL